mmetsp:Transcript_95708/g.270861  ORF Transcript_95708/g.270861 Transcript_95708/m.270861 type:complete len:217 (+) Transcript_95708:191-841(+)
MYKSNAWRRAISHVSGLCRLLQGGPKSRNNCMAHSTFSFSVRPELAVTAWGAGPLIQGVGSASAFSALVWCASCEHCEMKPKNKSRKMPPDIPMCILYGTTKITTKEGIATRRLSQAILRHGSIINTPVRTIGAAAAMSGMELNKGVKKADNRKSADTTTAERPVRAPSMMPALLSFAITKGLVPSSAPTIVPTATPETMPLLPGTPSNLKRPAIP